MRERERLIREGEGEYVCEKERVGEKERKREREIVGHELIQQCSCLLTAQ